MKFVLDPIHSGIFFSFQQKTHLQRHLQGIRINQNLGHKLFIVQFHFKISKGLQMSHQIVVCVCVCVCVWRGGVVAFFMKTTILMFRHLVHQIFHKVLKFFIIFLQMYEDIKYQHLPHSSSNHGRTISHFLHHYGTQAL